MNWDCRFGFFFSKRTVMSNQNESGIRRGGREWKKTETPNKIKSLCAFLLSFLQRPSTRQRYHIKHSIVLLASLFREISFHSLYSKFEYIPTCELISWSREKYVLKQRSFFYIEYAKNIQMSGVVQGKLPIIYIL